MNDSAVKIVKTDSSSGTWQEAQEKALWAPAAKALGIAYAKDSYQGWADARKQIEAGSVTLDIIQISLIEEPQAKAAGVLEKLDEDVFNPADFVPGSYTDYFVPNSIYSTLIAWNRNTYGGSGPSSRADFWDVDRFPGKRALWNEPSGMIEAAVLALGTPREQVYEFLSTEEGRKAAIDKLAGPAPHVSVWWESGAEAVQLMTAGAVDMILTWGGRIQEATDGGANFAYSFVDGQLGTDGYAVVRGAPHRDAAMRLLKEMSKPEYHKDLPCYFSTALANVKAYDLAGFSPEKLATMASAPQNVAVQYAADPDWWSRYGAWASEAYAKVRLSR